MQLPCVVEVLLRQCRGDFVDRDGLPSVVAGEDSRQRGPNAVSMRTLRVNIECKRNGRCHASENR